MQHRMKGRFAAAGMALALLLSGCGGGGSVADVASAGRAQTLAVTPAASVVANDPVVVPVPPPIMGWSSWNSLDNHITFDKIKAEADALVALNQSITSGPKYDYVNLDEGWWLSGQRDADGSFKVDNAVWPGGMKGTADYIHSLGLKAGIYIDAGPSGCGTRPNGTNFVGSDPAHYDSDFLQFAHWGFDFVKVDFCGGQRAGYNPKETYTLIAQALDKAYIKTGHRVILNMCDWGIRGANPAKSDYGQGPWVWGASQASSWRTTYDIYSTGTGAPQFSTVMRNFDGNYHPEYQHTGHYNDADMMVAGLGMSEQQDKAHVALWAGTGIPMVLGNDLAKPMNAATKALITNTEAIAINQDPLGLQALKIRDAGGLQVWVKRLVGTGQRAVLVLNRTGTAADIAFSWADLGLKPGNATVHDVFAKADATAVDSYTSSQVPANGAQLYRVSGSETAPHIYAPGALGDGAKRVDCAGCASGKAVQLPGRVDFDGLVAGGGYGLVQLAYLNDDAAGSAPRRLRLIVNGDEAGSTLLSLPPTGKNGQVGQVTLTVRTKAGSNSLRLASADASATAPLISDLRTLPGGSWIEGQEAESTDNTRTAGTNLRTCQGCSGQRVVGYIGYGRTLTFNGLNVGATGQYDVGVSYVSGDGPRQAQLSINGQAPVTVDFPATANWQTPATLHLKMWLNAGSNSLKLDRTNGWAPDMDAISGPVPVTLPVAVEAEKGTLSGGAKTTACAACSGGSLVQNIGQGGQVALPLTSSSAGLAYVGLTYVNGDAGPRSALVSINGAAPVTVSFPSTGSWTQTGQVAVSASLTAGSNTITISQPSGWGPDLDGLTAPSTALIAK